MRGTPETDALRKSIDNGSNAEAEMTLFAGKLELERDEATRSLEKERIAINYFIERGMRERDEVRALADDMAEKAKELITRWDQPSWKDTAPTAGFIYALRDAVQAYEKRQN